MTELINQTLNLLFLSAIIGFGFMQGVYFWCKLSKWTPTQLNVTFKRDEGIQIAKIDQ